jgi:hypothetical protein
MTGTRLLDAPRMRQAFAALDDRLARPLFIIVGGGGGMALAHKVPLKTSDVDAIAVPAGSAGKDVEEAARKVGAELGIARDWLNRYFEQFTYVLPPDYRERLVPVFKGRSLEVQALGAEDLLVMKCFAGREKDIPHARALMRKVKDLDRVDAHLSELLEKGVPRAREAADFFDDLRSDLGL